MSNVMRLSELVGGGYSEFWHSKQRYRVVKGSRASKKSKTCGLYYPYMIAKHPGANLLCVRKTYSTIKDSQLADLKWGVHRLGMDDLWDFKAVPLEAIYKPTGQKVLFRGLDDPLKITSITVDVGHLCWLWCEEAYELVDEGDFDTLDESIRGKMPDDLWKQTTLTLNPWNERSWIKKRFFDVDSPDVLAMTVDYRVNEWLDDADLRMFEDMKERNPRRYKVAGLGEWGAAEGMVYERWREANGRGDNPLRFEKEDILEQYPNVEPVFGLDFGYTNDPSAFFCGLYDKHSRTLWVFDEFYEKGMSNRAIADKIKAMGYGKERIVCDSAEPKSIDELRSLGIRAVSAKKGKDSVLNGIQFIQDLEIIVHPRCSAFLTEISNYGWDKDRFGKTLNRPADGFDHLMDAMRYSLQEHIGFKTGIRGFKEGI